MHAEEEADMTGRWTVIALAFAGLAAPALAETTTQPTIQAWCTGGIAGIYQYVSVTPDGEIRAVNRPVDGPWPVVGTDLAAASRWFAALALQGPADPVAEDDDAPVVMDAIHCGLSVSGDGKVVPYDHPDVHHKIMAWVPGR